MYIPHFDHVIKASPAENSNIISYMMVYHESGLHTPKCLTCVKGGHMEGHELQFWMCECPVEKRKSLHGFNYSIDFNLLLSVLFPYLHADWAVLP